MTRWFTRMMAVAIAGLAAATTANASIIIGVSEDAGPISVVATGANFTAINFSGTTANFSYNGFGGSSVNGAASNLLSSTTSVTNTSGATHTLHLWVSQTDYTLPVGTPLSVESGLGGSLTQGTLGLTGIFQAFADNGNQAISNGNPPPAFSFTNGAQTAVGGSTFDTGSAVGLFPRTGANSLYSLASVANFTLTAGGIANYSDHVIVHAQSTPPGVPAPPAVFLIGAAVPVLALRRWSAKRKAALAV
jgi:hypothetical protein